MTKDTSWETVNKWYKKSVNTNGHYYHKSLVIPGSLRLLNLKPKHKVLDLACGQGVLSRHINNDVSYLGLDLSESLIESAKKLNKNSNHKFDTKDISVPFEFNTKFTHAVIILALQNIQTISALFKSINKTLEPSGKLLIVINHPHFRIPKLTSWQVDTSGKVQFRRIDAYMSSLEIPIQHEPSKGEKSPITWTYHYPLHQISQELSHAGFKISTIEEWVSDKTSVGKNSQRENTARAEFPLFMAILAEKF